MMTRFNASLRDNYNDGRRIFKPAVLRVTRRDGTPQWLTLGSGHEWAGCVHETFEDAIKEALDGHRPVS